MERVLITGTTATTYNPATADTTGTVSLDGSIAVTNSADTATRSSITVGSGAPVTLAALNTSRIGLVIYNLTGVLFVQYGSSASSTDFTFKLTTDMVLEINNYRGVVTAIKQTGTSQVLVTEL